MLAQLVRYTQHAEERHVEYDLRWYCSFVIVG